MRCCLVLAALLASSGAWAATYYASPAGSGEACSLASPCALATAKTTVQTAIAGGLTDNARVLLRAGTYTLAAGLTFGAADSPPNGYRVTWQSYPTELAVIDGGEVITGWSLHAGTIYKASVTDGRDFRALFVDGVHRQRARGADIPCSDPPTCTDSTWARTLTGYTSPSDISGWGNFSAIEARHRGSWAVQFGKFASATGTAITASTPWWTVQETIKAGWVITATPLWIENALELLDADEEWYLDKTADLLYYQPTSGSMSGLTVVAPLVETLLTLDGASNLSFVNLTFRHANWTGPESATGYSGNNGYYQTSYDTALLPPGAIEIKNSDSIVLAQNTYERMSAGLVIRLYDGNDGVAITNSTFRENSGGEIQVGNAADPLDCQAPSENIVIRNNYVAAGGAWDYESAPGFVASCANGFTVSHNEVAKDARGWAPIISNGYPYGFTRSGSITHNLITRSTVSLYPDNGAIYCVGDQSQGQGWPTGMTVESNSITTGGSHNCLYSDFLSAFITSSRNLCRGADWYWLHLWSGGDHSWDAHDQTFSYNYYDSGGVDPFLPEKNITLIGNTSIVSGDVATYGTYPHHINCAAGVSWGTRPGAQPNADDARYTNTCLQAPSGAWRRFGGPTSNAPPAPPLVIVHPLENESLTYGAYYNVEFTFNVPATGNGAFNFWFNWTDPGATIPDVEGQSSYSLIHQVLATPGTDYKLQLYHRPDIGVWGNWDYSVETVGTFSIVVP